jgi:acyl-CoA thioester hydrolase
MTDAAHATDDAPSLEELRSRRKSDYPVLRAMQLRWADVDTYGHVNNAVHYQLMDTAVNAWLSNAAGVDIRTLPAIGVVVETRCRYLQELHFSASLEVGIRLAGAGRSSVRYDVGFFVNDEGPIAVARFVHVYIDPHSRRPTPIPREVLDALDKLN